VENRFPPRVVLYQNLRKKREKSGGKFGFGRVENETCVCRLIDKIQPDLYNHGIVRFRIIAGEEPILRG
jgi:hypothetical protein